MPGWLLVVGLWAATTVVARAGLQWPVLGLVILGGVLALRGRSPRASRGDVALVVLSVALVAVAALRDDGFTVTLCVLGALLTAGVPALGARRPWAVLAAPVELAVSGVLAWGWVARWLARAPRPALGQALVRGLLIGVPLALLVGGLLVSADAVIGSLVEGLLRGRMQPLRLGPAQLALGLIAMLVALAFGHAVVRRPVHRRAAARAAAPTDAVAASHASSVEWIMPLALLAVALALFDLVQLLEAAGVAPGEGTGGSWAHAARSGFGQLLLVTVIVALALGWAATRAAAAGQGADRAAASGEREARAADAGRRVFGCLGGAVLLLTLGVVASALTRMARYQQAYGWSVLRLDVTVVELWLGLALVIVALAWAARRSSSVPRLVVGSAAATLLGLALLAPDALVARWNVERYVQTGRLDVDYAQTLSADAVPAYTGLPEPARSCVLVVQRVERLRPDPWYAVNLSRGQARAILSELPAMPDTERDCSTLR